MKKSRQNYAHKLAAIMFAVVLAVGLCFSGSVNTYASYVPDDESTIGGVTYFINGSGSNASCDAYISQATKGQEEIIVRSSVTINGKTYKVDNFLWDLYDRSWNRLIRPSSFNEKVDKGSPQDVLKKITIEKGVDVTYVEGAYNYKNLEEVIVEDPEQLGNLIFVSCPKLKGFHITKESKGLPGLFDCPNAKLTIDSENPYYKMIGKDVYTKDGKTLCFVGSKKSTYKVKSGVTAIAQYAFYGNMNIKKIYVPNSVKKIGCYAFAMMKNLKSVRLSRNLKQINQYTFEGTSKLTKITFPASVKKIEGGFFGASYYKGEYCGLKKVYINTRNLKKSSLGSLPKNCKVYVKNAKVKKQVKKYGFKGKIIIKK